MTGRSNRKKPQRELASGESQKVESVKYTLELQAETLA